MCGIRPDRECKRLEEALDWLETACALVERFDANTASAELTNRPVAKALLTRRPRGVVTTRSQLARFVGNHRAVEKQTGAGRRDRAAA